ncbi:uncharacterized protein LOC117113912 [Anneissia japonica]|uniref:uncharacterized protein LOC117113912 n=1 Tax=Anneissia japonica TaxID=1529436 RepID=UPI0014255FF0|nr:uncharacterized protein LOC117113912 [Anneissia japonica]
MESDRKIKLAELRQKRLAYYNNQAHHKNIAKWMRDVEIETSEKNRCTNEKLAFEAVHDSDIKHSNREISVSHSPPIGASQSADEESQREPANQSLNQQELINRYFEEPDRTPRRKTISTLGDNESYDDENWFEHLNNVDSGHGVTNSAGSNSSKEHLIDKPFSQLRSYKPFNDVYSEHQEHNVKQDNIQSRGSIDDCNRSSHGTAPSRKHKKRNKVKKSRRNEKYQSEKGTQNVERKPLSPSLPTNFFDLDSLQNAARNGDDVLRKYIQELSTKMVNSQTETNHISESNYDFPANECNLKQASYPTTLFALSHDPSPTNEDSFFQHERKAHNYVHTRHNYTTKSQDFNFHYNDHENIHNMPLEYTKEEVDMDYSRVSSEFDDQKSKYVPKICKPAILSSQLQKLGLCDDIQSDLSLHYSQEKDEDLYQFLDYRDHGENDFDLLTHRPSNRPISPLIQPTSYSEIYEVECELTPKPPQYDELHLITHRPKDTTERRNFERVEDFYRNEKSSRSKLLDFSIDGNPTNNAKEWFNDYDSTIRSTSPEQHMLAVRKYHNIEKHRRKSRNQINGDSIRSRSTPFKHEEIDSRHMRSQETNSKKSSVWHSDKKDDIFTRNESEGDVELLICDDHAKPVTDIADHTLTPALNMTQTLSMPEHEIKLNEIDSEPVLEMFDRKQDYTSHDANQNESDSKQRFDSSNTNYQRHTFDFYDKQLIPIPPSRSPEPKISTNLHHLRSSHVLTPDENPDIEIKEVLLDANKFSEDSILNLSSNPDHEAMKPLSLKLDLSFNTEDDSIEYYRVKTPLLENILENTNNMECNPEVIDNKNFRSSSPANSKKKGVSRLLDRGSTHKPRWLTSSSLSSSVLTSKKFTNTFKDSKRSITGGCLSLSRKDVSVSKELSRSQGMLQDRSSSGEKWQRSPQKKVAKESFFTVRPAKTAESNGTNIQQKCALPLTLQLLSDSPRGGEGLSLWQLLPDELLFHIFSYLSPSSLAVTAQVCQTFHRIANDELLWKSIMLQKKDLTDDWLMQIGKKHPTTISFLQCNGMKVSEGGLRTMFRACSKSLKELNVSGSTGGDLIGDSILLHASRCRGLTSLDVSWCSVTNNGLISIAESIQMLGMLCLNGCQAVTDDSINMILKKHCKSLRVLEVFGCFNISPAVISQIGKVCKNLQALNVGQCYKMTDDHMLTMVSHLEHVQHLDMRGCKQIHDTTVRKIVRCCKKLKSVSLANCGHLTDASLVEFATYLPTIGILDVSGCKKITNHGVYTLAKSCYQLSSLDLSSTSVNYKSVSSLASYCGKSLQILKLNFCQDITEKSVLKLLHHCKRLEMLQLYGVKGLRNLSSIKSQFPCLKLD